MLCVVDIEHLNASEYATTHARGALRSVGVVISERVTLIKHLDDTSALTCATCDDTLHDLALIVCPCHHCAGYFELSYR